MGLPNSANLYQQMQEAENKMNSYNLAGAPGNIGKAVRGAVRNLQPQFQELGRAEAQAYKVPQQVMADYLNNYDDFLKIKTILKVVCNGKP